MRMRKVNTEILFTILVAFLACCLVFLAYTFKAVMEAPRPVQYRTVYVYAEPEKETVTEVRTETKLVPIKVQPQPETILSMDDLEALAAVVHNEAGNQDMIGKRLVVDVVLNRCDSGVYPDSVLEVVQQEGQFKSGGGYTDEDMEAVKLECESRLDHSVMYFRTGQYHRSGQRLYQHGDHFFSGR